MPRQFLELLQFHWQQGIKTRPCCVAWPDNGYQYLGDLWRWNCQLLSVFWFVRSLYEQICGKRYLKISVASRLKVPTNFDVARLHPPGLRDEIRFCRPLDLSAFSEPPFSCFRSNSQTYCWWLKSCTSWYGKYPIIYRVSAPSQVVQDFSHQQYHCILQSTCLKSNLQVAWVLTMDPLIWTSCLMGDKKESRLHQSMWQPLLKAPWNVTVRAESGSLRCSTTKVTARTADARKQLQQQETWNGRIWRENTNHWDTLPS